MPPPGARVTLTPAIRPASSCSSDMPGCRVISSDVTVEEEAGTGAGVWAASRCPWAHAAMVATSTAAGKTRDGYEVMGPPLIPNIALIHRDWRHTC